MVKLAPNKAIYELCLKFDKMLGLKFDELKEEKQEIPQEVLQIAQERQLARQEKNWAKSDELRDKLLNLGYKILDSRQGYTIEKI